MRIATIEVETKSRVVVVDDSGENYWNIEDILPGFEGDMLDLIQAVPAPANTLKTAGAGQPLAGRRLLAPMQRTVRNLSLVGKTTQEIAKNSSGSGLNWWPQVWPSAPTFSANRQAPSSVRG